MLKYYTNEKRPNFLSLLLYFIFSRSDLFKTKKPTLALEEKLSSRNHINILMRKRLSFSKESLRFDTDSFYSKRTVKKFTTTYLWKWASADKINVDLFLKIFFSLSENFLECLTPFKMDALIIRMRNKSYNSFGLSNFRR